MRKEQGAEAARDLEREAKPGTKQTARSGENREANPSAKREAKPGAKREANSGSGLALVTHEFAPVFDAHARVLLLGSIPSPKSRETHFYYGHPRNRFWKTLSAVFGAPVPETIPEKKTFLLAHGIALWDVLQSCLIHGADDGSIAEPVPNDIAGLLRQTEVHRVFTTGSKAYALYMKYCYPQTQMPAVKLPSTSPANCRMKDEKLQEAYRAVLEALMES